MCSTYFTFFKPPHFNLNQIVFFQLHFSFCTGELCIFGAPLMIFKQLLVTIYIFVFKYFLFVYLAQNSTQGWETGIFLKQHIFQSIALLVWTFFCFHIRVQRAGDQWTCCQPLNSAITLHIQIRWKMGFVHFGFKVCQMRKLLRTFKNPQGCFWVSCISMCWAKQ